MPITVKQIIANKIDPITVTLKDTVQTALSLMLNNDFDVLPVIDEEYRIQGIATLQGIVSVMRHLNPPLESLVVQFISEKYVIVDLNTDLKELLKKLRPEPAVLVVNDEQKLAGILTAWDAMIFLRNRTENIAAIQDIEGALKDHIRVEFANDETGQTDDTKLKLAIIEKVNARSRKVATKAINMYINESNLAGTSKELIRKISDIASYDESASYNLDDLTLNELIEVLLHKEAWETYKSNFSAKETEIRSLLNLVRKTRNKIAHFKGEATFEEREALAFCSDWLMNRNPAPKFTTSPEVLENLEDATIPEEEIGSSEEPYLEIGSYLRGIRGSMDQVSLNFGDIEKIINRQLPPSAREHRNWWANNKEENIQSRYWLDVGWRVGRVHMPSEQVSFIRIKERENAYIAFFTRLLNSLKATATFQIPPVNPMGLSWETILTLPRNSNKRPASLVYSFTRGDRFRVELYIDCGDKEKNKAIFNGIYSKRDEIEEELGASLSWEELISRRASRIAWYHEGSIIDTESQLEKLRAWAVDAMIKFEKVIAEHAEGVIKTVLK